METNYKRTIAGSVGAGMAAVFNGSGRQYYILEHKTESVFHHAGESQKIIVDQIEMGRDSSCQVRFDESFETVSRRHAAIVKEGNGWKIINLSQTNPTFVNGQPIPGEWTLSSGDEIRLSSRGPLMGFIVPQGKQSLVSSIGMTERLNLFRQQALRPYKTALWIMAIVLILAVGGLITWNLLQSKQFDQEIQAKQEQIQQVQKALDASDAEIDELNNALIDAENKSAAEKARVQRQLRQAQEERDALYEHAVGLRDELQDAVNSADKANRKVESAQNEINNLNNKLEEMAARPEPKPEPTPEEIARNKKDQETTRVQDAIKRRVGNDRPTIH